MKFIDLTGRVFGRLTVIGFAKRIKTSYYWNCRCICGKDCLVSRVNLKSRTKSCGCMRGDFNRKTKTTHGHSKITEFMTWVGMKDRCYNIRNRSYKYYGGRGITVCDEWFNSFENFIKDMGIKPLGYTLERIENDKGYYKENCKWATMQEQSRNKRYNVWYAYGDKSMIQKDWAKEFNVGASTLRYHLKTKDFKEVYERYVPRGAVSA